MKQTHQNDEQERSKTIKLNQETDETKKVQTDHQNLISEKPKIEQNKPPTIIFALMTLTNILINLDHGILPACTNEMKDAYQMNDTQLGFLGSIVYLGIVLMGTFAGQFYLRINSKLLTIIALVTLEVTLVLFILAENKYIAYITRFFTGVCQVFLLVYYPVWIDKFGQNLKTLWLTLLQVCVPVGIFIGYGITSVIVNFQITYKLSFAIQIGLVLIFLIAFILVPKAKLDSRRKEEEQFHQNFSGDLRTPLTENLMPSQDTMPKFTINPKKKKHSYIQNMKKLIRSKMYLVGTLTMSIILFVSTGIQFWMTDYLVNVLEFDQMSVNIAYAVVSITGPTIGCGFGILFANLGGYVINKIGGYEHPTTVYYVLMFCCIGIGSALVIPFVDSFYPVCVLLWCVLFFGGAMMPGLTGLMMVSVPPHLRAFGNSNGQIVKNVLGYLPAPFFYGWANYLFDSKRAGIRLIMYWGLWAPLLLGIGSFIRFGQIRKVSLQQAKKLIQNQAKLISSSSEIEQPLSGEQPQQENPYSINNLPIKEQLSTNDQKAKNQVHKDQ